MRRLTNTSHSDSRRNKILDAIVRLYVHDVEPVASGAVCRRFRTGLSPASVRNVMAELEERGYIRQPHTSAGRVPTERGYRHYVNVIMEPERLAPEEQALIESQIVGREHDLNSLMDVVSDVLASMTQLMSLVLFPLAARETIRHIEVVNLSANRVMVAWLLSSGVLKSAVVNVGEPLDQGLVQRITNFVNDQLEGAPLDGIADLLARRAIAEEGSLYYVMQQAMELLQRGLQQVIDDRLAYGGARWMLAQPEFRDPARVSPLLQALDERQAILQVLYQAIGSPGVEVYIGQELPVEAIHPLSGAPAKAGEGVDRGVRPTGVPLHGATGLPVGLHECSLVTSSYAVRGQPVGAVGVLGPTRMPYPKVTAVVQRIAGALSRVLTEAAG